MVETVKDGVNQFANTLINDLDARDENIQRLRAEADTEGERLQAEILRLKNVVAIRKAKTKRIREDLESCEDDE